MKATSSLDQGIILRSLFREITRGLRRIRAQPAILQTEETSSAEFENEVKKARINSLQYRDYLLSEIRHNTIQKFSVRPKNHHVKDHIIHSQLWQGHNLVEKLCAINKEPCSSSAWKGLVELVLADRNQQLLKSKWALDYKKHKKVIDAGHLKELHPLQAKRALSRQKDRSPRIVFSSDKEYKLNLAKSRDNASWVVRNYLKRLQLAGKIPNPFKLPYVSQSMYQQSLQLPKIVNVFPGSTKLSVLQSAYDMDYIESIVKREIEYLLNKRHYLEKYQKIVNKRGPSRVQIRSTSAGIMQAHFIRSPAKDKRRMKKMAIDIKKSTRVIRKQFVWKLDASQSESLSERMVGDGYAVRGSGGYSMDEVMYTRRYHEDMALKEAEWEFLMKLEELKAKYGQDSVKESRVATQLGKLRRQITKEWVDPLDTATKAIDDEVESFFLKYKVSENSPLWKRRELLQDRMNKNYANTCGKFEKLIELLRRDCVCAHSDLFYRSRENKQGRQTSESELKLRGKTLGNYLEQVGLRGYKMGYEFRRRLNIA